MTETTRTFFMVTHSIWLFFRIRGSWTSAFLHMFTNHESSPCSSTSLLPLASPLPMTASAEPEKPELTANASTGEAPTSAWKKVASVVGPKTTDRANHASGRLNALTERHGIRQISDAPSLKRRGRLIVLSLEQRIGAFQFFFATFCRKPTEPMAYFVIEPLIAQRKTEPACPSQGAETLKKQMKGVWKARRV